ncbi:MAG: hypothetical protein WCW87_00315 [Candidatus Paceibacterota bacterium]
MKEKIIIDCDINPPVPQGYMLHFHIKLGRFVWDPKKLSLETQEGHWKSRIGLRGNIKQEQLQLNRDANANIFNHLLCNPEQIPDYLKEYKRVLFWGTCYRKSRPPDCLSKPPDYVPYLSFRTGPWWSWGLICPILEDFSYDYLVSKTGPEASVVIKDETSE